MTGFPITGKKEEKKIILNEASPTQGPRRAPKDEKFDENF